MSEDLIFILKKLDNTVSRLSNILEGFKIYTDVIRDANTLLSLPDHLRTTAIAVLKFGRMTATQCSEITKRKRAVESSYLNQLVLFGYIKKEHIKREVYFYPKES